MTKEVSVRIEGLQLGAEEEPMVTTASGIYHLHNDRHYVRYNEKPAEEGLTKSIIKIALTKIELTRSGANSSQMVFDLNEETTAIYQTPYGDLSFEVKTSEITVDEEPDKIQVKLEYSLSTGDSHVSDNRIEILITSNE